MKINKRLRVVISTILISILMTIVSPLGQCVCYADADDTSLSVDFSDPEWSYDIFSYGTVTVAGASGSNKIKTISIHTDNGYIVGGQIPSNKTSVNDLTDEERTLMLPTPPSGGKWTTELPGEKDGYVTYQTAVCTLGSVGYSGEETAAFITQIEFMLKDYSTNIDVTIDLDASDNSLPEGSNVTRGSNDGVVNLSDHYYMYVPNATEATIKWDDAFNDAKSLEFMGMKGYLATITSEVEDKILDNITMAGAWAGAAMIKRDYHLDDVAGSSNYWRNKSTSEWLSEPVRKDGYFGDYSWKWVCGPEAGTDISITGGYAAGDTMKVYNPETGYSNWNRKTKMDDGSEITIRPDGGDEPNNSDGKEYCMQVHYTSPNGHSESEHSGVMGWNDLPNHDVSDYGHIRGYFVEFSGLDVTKTTHASKSVDQPYTHSSGGWKYDHVASGEMTAEQRVVITCIDSSHLECLYKPKKADGITDNPLYREVVLTIDASGKDYNDGPVGAATVTFTEKINEVETSIPESDYSKFGFDYIGAVNYISTDQQGYSSTTPPTDAGEYKAVTGLYKSGQADPIISVEKAFTISKVPLKITLNDQVVYVGDDIKRNIDVIDTDKHKCLISSIDELKSPDNTDAKRDKLDSVALTAIKPSTTDIKDYAVGYEKANAITIENPATNIVIKSAYGTRDVTKNYDITVVNGGIKVTKHPTKTLDYPDDPKATVITYGQTLSESEITGKCNETGTSIEVKGDFAWKNSDDGKSPDQIYPEVSDSETTEYNAAFNPKEPGTYESIDFKQKVKVNPKSIPENLGEKIDLKTGKDIGINSKISVDIANNAVVELYDKQTGKDLVKGTDYTVTEIINSGTKKVEITITGQGNYKDTTSTFYVDAHEFKSVFETEVVVESSAQELKPGASKIDVSAGKKYLEYQVNKLGSSEDDKRAKTIAKEVEKSPTDTSSNGSYQALATVTISNVNYISATAETDTDEKEQKLCAEDAIGASGAAGKKTVPAGATIGMYFDVDMDLEYLMYKPSETKKPFIERKRSATNPDEGPIKIHDTSKTAVAVDPSISDFAGIEEEVQIVVPNRKGIDDKPLYAAKGYSRTYYIIRTHDEDGVAPYNYEWEVLDVTRGKTDDGLIKLTFKTDKFSKYALAYTETKDPEKKKDIPTSDEPSSSSSSSSNSTFTAANVKQAAPTTVQIVAPKTADTADMPAAVILVIAGIVLIFYVITMDSDERKNDEQSTQIKVRLSEKLNREILKVKLKLLIESIENCIKDIKNKKNPGAR